MLLTVLVVVCPQRLIADTISPLLVQINELRPEMFGVNQQRPPALPEFFHPKVVLPGACAPIPISSPAARWAPDSRRWYQCPGGLRGGKISIEYGGPRPAVLTAIRINFLSGETLSGLLRPGETDWQVPAAETWRAVAAQYTIVGIGHILQSVDHLLFVMCLLWIAGSMHRVLITITGFTLAHSVTLILSALNVVEVPGPPIEAAISLSILFLAAEIARGKHNSVSWRYPIAVSSVFGLLHGLGFAEALKQIGLPHTELITGLLFFNVGVEIGQLAFVLVAISVQQALARTRIDWPWIVRRIPIYMIGAMSATWTIRGVLSF